MDDIVARLRDYEIGNLASQECWVAEMHEAADEIECLRKYGALLLDRIADLHLTIHPGWYSIFPSKKDKTV